MGTYRQPSQVIDKSFDTLNQGLENVNQQIGNELRFQRAQEIARAKEAKKEQEEKDKELKNLRDRQQAATDGYQVEIDNFENINQPRTESWEQEDVAVTNQIKNNSKYFLDIMSDNLPGTEAYRGAERALKNMIKQYPVMASLFNQEAEQTDSAFVNGAKIGENEDGAILNSNDPLQSVKLHMLRDLRTGKNPERFQVLSLPSGQVFKYEDGDGKVFETAYQDYVDFRENGGNLIDTVNGEEYNTFMDGIWNKTLKKTYDTLSTKITSYREGIRNGDPVNFKDVEVSYTQANKNLDNTLDNWVDGGGSVSQSTWQMLGGSGVYNPKENKEQLKTYLKTKVKDRFTTQEDKYTLSEQEIKEGGGKSSSDSSGNGTINPEEKSYSDKFINNLKDLKEGKKGSEDPYIGTELDGRNIRKIKKDGDSITFVTQDLDSSGEATGEPFSQTFNLNNKKQIENLERKLLKQTPKNYDVSVIETYINTKTDDFVVGEESFDIDPLISFQEFNKEETGVVSKLKDLYPNVTFEEAIPGTNAISVKIGDQDAKEFKLSNKDDYNKFIRLVDPKYDKGDPTKGMTDEEKIKYYLANSSK
tara:strand:+ start:12543 stop:14306 length:1764 start_codon:yes stop_codon:yes gene_type:complete